eukprot:210403-Prymnesium_polylepis.3
MSHDGVLCYHGGTPGGRLRWARGTCGGSREPPTDESASFDVRSSAVTAARTGEATFWGRIWFFGPFGATSRLRHATRRLIRGSSARRATPAYATGVGRALSARALSARELYRPPIRGGSCGYPAEGRPAGFIRASHPHVRARARVPLPLRTTRAASTPPPRRRRAAWNDVSG